MEYNRTKCRQEGFWVSGLKQSAAEGCGGLVHCEKEIVILVIGDEQMCRAEVGRTHNMWQFPRTV